MNYVIQWIIYSVAIGLVAYLLPGVQVTNVVTAVLAAAVLGLLNIFLKPLLVALTLPINVVTLGLFVLIINAFLVYLTARVIPGFSIVNFWWALLFGILLSFVHGILTRMLTD